MNIIAFETATERMTLALQFNERLFTVEMDNDARHSKVLIPKIEELLADAGASFSKLNGVVVGTGPGGFTGLRIGLAVAQGLSLAHQIPIYPVSTLLNVASGCDGFTQALVVMDARMGEVYTQLFELVPVGPKQPNQWKALDEAQVLAPVDIKLPEQHHHLAVVGQGLLAYEEIFSKTLKADGVAWKTDVMPTASRAIALRGRAVEAWALRPNYVRNDIAH